MATTGYELHTLGRYAIWKSWSTGLNMKEVLNFNKSKLRVNIVACWLGEP
jgi:hypothetical protein